MFLLPLSTDEPVLEVGAGGTASNAHLLRHLHDLGPGLGQPEAGQLARVAQPHTLTRHGQYLSIRPRDNYRFRQVYIGYGTVPIHL